MLARGMDIQVKALATVFIVFGALGLLAAFVVSVVFGTPGAARAIFGSTGLWMAPADIRLTRIAICALLLAVSLAGVAAGIGLLALKGWARLLAIVLSALNLINVPLGTVLGVYGLCVLLSEQGSRLFPRAVPPADAT